MDGTRVVVTGLGVAVPGVAGAADLLRPDPRGDAGDPVEALRARGLRYRDRATKLVHCAGRDALADAGLLDAPDAPPRVPGEQIGVVVSTNYGNVDTVCETVATIAKETYLGTSPMLLPATASNVTASWFAISYGLRGANLTLCNGATSGLDALHWGRALVAAGRVRWAVVAGAEPDNEPVRHLTAGGTNKADKAEGNGGLLNGGAAVVLESARTAEERGAAALAELGPYARKATVHQAVAEVRHASPGEVGLWCLPERPMPVGPPGLSGAEVCDLTRALGDGSGALGVLQAVAGTSWLNRRAETAPGRVLATAGVGEAAGQDAASALVLTAAVR